MLPCDNLHINFVFRSFIIIFAVNCEDILHSL